ncbi:HNH endonuclease [Acinetobacter colistiniresistens]|uniref:HNH endonuclease n=1 Tax=Acinetobacter colistiniresistens TaxID=280145 RepID=UPI00211C7811|nr:HNH endonuclease signature motif containing protein [Acinetobacter colistiniresistens]UUM28507.1 HNH endonuclease [Acinetobacter colistiniresistens]
MDNYNYLTLNEVDSVNTTTSSDFNENRKSAVFIQESLKNINLCNICGCPVHKNSISIDHIQKKSDGGLGTIKNGQVTHPFCNTGFKN